LSVAKDSFAGELCTPKHGATGKLRAPKHGHPTKNGACEAGFTPELHAAEPCVRFECGSTKPSVPFEFDTFERDVPRKSDASEVCALSEVCLRERDLTKFRRSIRGLHRTKDLREETTSDGGARGIQGSARMQSAEHLGKLVIRDMS